MIHQLEELIIEQYRIINFIGEGIAGEAYKAFDLKHNDHVVLKALSLRRMKNWKTMELFKREARVLAQLKHPAIPNYLNYFQREQNQEKYWYIVQEFVSGQSLSTLVGNSWRATEAEIGYNFLSGYSYNEQSGSRSVVARCFIVEGTKAKQFGRYIKRVEKEWLIREINSFLNKLREY